MVWLSSSSCLLCLQHYLRCSGFLEPGHCPVYMGTSIRAGPGTSPFSLFGTPSKVVRGIPVLSSAMSSPYSITPHGPKPGPDFPAHSSDHSCHQACVHSFFLDGEPLGFHLKVDVGDRGAEKLPETSAGIKGPTLEFWNSKSSALVPRAEIIDRL